MTFVDLQPPELREERPAAAPGVLASQPSGGWLIVGALLLSVIGATLLALAANGVDERQTRLTAAEQETQVVGAAAERLQPYVAFATAAERRTAAVTQLAGTRFPWDRALGDLTHVLPRDAHLTNVSATLSAGASAGGGGGDSSLRSALDVPALTIEGCLSSQGRIPDLLSRLGDLRGATRVALASSEAAEDAEGEIREDAACRSAAAPTFSTVVYFEGWQSTLPTSADGAATAAPVATPAPTETAAPAAEGTAAPDATETTPQEANG